MRCLTAEQVFDLLAPLKFSVSDENRWYRRELVFLEPLASKQDRISASPPADPRRLPYFIQAINAWLPSGRGRLLWIQHWEVGNPYNSEALVSAARAGLGEGRSIDEAPGHLFDVHPYGNLDIAEISNEHKHELGLLVGFVSLLLLEACDGWLLAEGCTDRIEFWEGNVLFHSQDAARMTDAAALFTQYDCAQMR